MNATTQSIVQRLWNYCNLLRDDGMSYGDYVEQLTYLLFLKMAYERTKPPYNQPSRIPKEYDWESLTRRDGDELEAHYRHLLEELGKQPGMLGIIFRKAQNKIQDPAKLRRLIVDLIGRPPDVVLCWRGILVAIVFVHWLTKAGPNPGFDVTFGYESDQRIAGIRS